MDRFMNKLLELFEESIILQGFITMAFVGTYCYMTIVGQEISDGLDMLTRAVLMFWFGTKSQAAVTGTIKRLGNGRTGSNPSVASSNSDS
jgi:hypothetical protein